MTEEFENQIINRLNVLIALELEHNGGDSPTSITSKIERLSAFGLATKDIASILNKSTNYITAVTSSKKKSAKKEGK